MMLTLNLIEAEDENNLQQQLTILIELVMIILITTMAMLLKLIATIYLKRKIMPIKYRR